MVCTSATEPTASQVLAALPLFAKALAKSYARREVPAAQLCYGLANALEKANDARRDEVVAIGGARFAVRSLNDFPPTTGGSDAPRRAADGATRLLAALASSPSHRIKCSTILPARPAEPETVRRRRDQLMEAGAHTALLRELGANWKNETARMALRAIVGGSERAYDEVEAAGGKAMVLSENDTSFSLNLPESGGERRSFSSRDLMQFFYRRRRRRFFGACGSELLR